MKARRLAQLAGVLLLAGSGTSFAQCETKEMDEDFAYVAKGGGGPACVNDHEESKKICITSGKIEGFEYGLVHETNIEGTTEVKQLDDQCVEATTTGHAKEASRMPNGWLCQPAERTIVIHITYCE